MNASGHIFQISASQGGVPKHAQPDAEVTTLGLSNDRHAHPENHGGPQKALCLYALERIVDLQGEGHPIYPGSAGENITVAHLDWSKVVPGARLRLGQDVEIEISDYTTPCKTIIASFADRDSTRILQATHPGWSRVYARVLSPGRIRVGDPVEFSGPIDDRAGLSIVERS